MPKDKTHRNFWLDYHEIPVNKKLLLELTYFFGKC